MKYLLNIFLGSWVVLLSTAMTSCSTNDDFGNQDIHIPGITFDGDAGCCSAEEALNVYNYLLDFKEIPELATDVESKYEVRVYTKTGTLHTGYNEIIFVATKKETGNYVKYLTVTDITPLMLMTRMNMQHSTPASEDVKLVNYDFPAVKRGWISFVMPTSDSGTWTLGYSAEVQGSTGRLEAAPITVAALPAGQDWVKSFKVDGTTYYLSLADPTSWVTGKNEVKAFLSVKGSDAKVPYGPAAETFSIDIDPRMPDMGNHTSPDNTALTQQTDGSYQGSVNLTMTGLWRIHLTVRDAQGNIVAGGDDLSEGYSSLYWDVTI